MELWGCIKLFATNICNYKHWDKYIGTHFSVPKLTTVGSPKLGRDPRLKRRSLLDGIILRFHVSFSEVWVVAALVFLEEEKLNTSPKLHQWQIEAKIMPRLPNKCRFINQYSCMAAIWPLWSSKQLPINISWIGQWEESPTPKFPFDKPWTGGLSSNPEKYWVPMEKRCTWGSWSSHTTGPTPQRGAPRFQMVNRVKWNGPSWDSSCGASSTRWVGESGMLWGMATVAVSMLTL